MPTGASRVEEVAKVKKAAKQFKHRQEVHSRQLRCEIRFGSGITGAGGAAGVVTTGLVPSGTVGSEGGESVKDKLDKLIANGSETN